MHSLLVLWVLVLRVAALSAEPASVDPRFTNSVGITMVRIEPGRFSMGSVDGDWDEQPVRQVTLTRAFYMADRELTNAQYEQFDSQHRQQRGKLGFSRDDDEAVVFVSWNDATAFCRWLSEKEGKPYRLPTEAEWEYACRAATTTDYSTGDALPAAMLKNSGESWFPGRTTAADAVPLHVSRNAPNAWGLFDMHGNVEEWCQDWYGPYAATDQTDPVGRAEGDFRVTRGGSHSTTAAYLRSANRSGTLPEDSSWLIGCRVVQAELPGTSPLPRMPAPRTARDVRQDIPADLSTRRDPSEPCFQGPQTYVLPPDSAECPVFNRHNHCPAIVNCANGDLLAIWYTCREEPGRELGIVASRLPYGASSGSLPRTSGMHPTATITLPHCGLINAARSTISTDCRSRQPGAAWRRFCAPRATTALPGRRLA